MALLLSLMVTDPELLDQIEDVLSRFDGPDAELGLFISDTELLPETVVEDLEEPSLDGYARKDLEDMWTAAARDEPGVWSAQTEIFTFEVDEAEEDGEDVYGAFILIAGELRAAGRFLEPFTWEVGSPLRLRVIYTQYAALVLQVLTLE